MANARAWVMTGGVLAALGWLHGVAATEKAATLEERVAELESALARLETRFETHRATTAAATNPAAPGDALGRRIDALAHDLRRAQSDATAARREAGEARRLASEARSTAHRALTR